MKINDIYKSKNLNNFIRIVDMNYLEDVYYEYIGFVITNRPYALDEESFLENFVFVPVVDAAFKGDK